MLISFVNGLATLAGQAYGSRNYATVGYNVQAALLLSTAIGIFPIVIWIFSAPILSLFGQEESVSRNSAKFLIILLPSSRTTRRCAQIL